jgi:hypothetical protein
MQRKVFLITTITRWMCKGICASLLCNIWPILYCHDFCYVCVRLSITLLYEKWRNCRLKWKWNFGTRKTHGYVTRKGKRKERDERTCNVSSRSSIWHMISCHVTLICTDVTPVGTFSLDPLTATHIMALTPAKDHRCVNYFFKTNDRNTSYYRTMVS